jgi:flagellar basal body rod protein FlgG
MKVIGHDEGIPASPRQAMAQQTNVDAHFNNIANATRQALTSRAAFQDLIYQSMQRRP